MNLDFDYKNLSQRLVDQWRSENVSLNPGATEEELLDFEKQFALQLPVDFRYFYSVVNGMPKLESDNHFFSLWPLERMQNEAEGIKVSDEIIELAFGDFLIDSHRYLLASNNTGSFFVKIQFGERLADNFAHFLQRYLSEPDKLYLL